MKQVRRELRLPYESPAWELKRILTEDMLGESQDNDRDFSELFPTTNAIDFSYGE